MALKEVATELPAASAHEGDQPASEELLALRSACRLWARTLDDADRAKFAGRFAWHAMESFSAELQSGHGSQAPYLGRDDGKLDRAALAMSREAGRLSARLPLVEGLHFVTSLYPALLPEGTRKHLGAFYTPPCLVERLLDHATEHGLVWSAAKVLDPAAGAGAILVQVALRMLDAHARVDPKMALRSIGSRLRGFEIDPVAADLGQFALEIVFGDLARRAGTIVPRMVRVCDTLEEVADASFDLVVGNPPYGRVSLTVEQRARFARSLYGHANLYGVFTDLAVRWAKPGGLIAYLTPTSFLAGQYFSALRRMLGDEAPPIAIDFVNARKGVFEDALQETLLAVYRRAGELGRTRIHYLDVKSDGEARVASNGTIALPANRGAPWLAPRLPEHGKLVGRLERMSARLADYGYSVSTGPLVWNRHREGLRSSAGGSDIHPLIWAECVTPDGKFVFRAMKREHAPYFRMLKGDEWLLTSEPCILVQRTTAKEQQRRLIAACLPDSFIREHAGVVVENHLNMVRSFGRELVSREVVAALLNSPVVDRAFRCMNGSVAVSAYELQALPLPSVDEIEHLTRLVSSQASVAEIARECERLYGCSSK